MRAVPVFLYHHVNWNVGDLVTLTPEEFEGHLRILKKRKFRTLFLSELSPFLRKEEALCRPSAVLTFDDGHLDNWVYAFPLLQKYQMKATIFVITSWMGEGGKRAQCDPDADRSLLSIPRHREIKDRAARGDASVALNWEEARAMEASGLLEIQSHTHFHRDYFLPRGKTFQLDAARKNLFLEDLARSKALIEARLGKSCRCLAWPWGKYDVQAMLLAEESGFETMVTTERGVNYAGSDERAIKRITARSGPAGWFSMRLRIYSHRVWGHLYSRIAGKI